jgi:hypothetical protein
MSLKASSRASLNCNESVVGQDFLQWTEKKTKNDFNIKVLYAISIFIQQIAAADFD